MINMGKIFKKKYWKYYQGFKKVGIKQIFAILLEIGINCL